MNEIAMLHQKVQVLADPSLVISWRKEVWKVYDARYKKGGEENTRTTSLTLDTTFAGSGGSCADAQGAIFEIQTS